MTRGAQNQQGFTLIEILIAIVLLSFVMIGVYTVTDNSTTTIERVTKEDSDFSQIEMALARLEQDFSQIYSPLYFAAKKEAPKEADPYQTTSTTTITHKNFPLTTDTGLPIPIIEQPSNQEIIFFSSANRRTIPNAKESSFAWIYYKLEDQSRDPDDELAEESRKGDYQLVRRIEAHDIYSDDINWEKIRPQVLLEHLKSFTILFWSDKKEDFVESIKSLDNSYLIRGIKIIIERYDANNQLEVIERIFRPLWPTFDTSLDAKAKSDSNNTLNNLTPPESPSEKNEED